MAAQSTTEMSALTQRALDRISVSEPYFALTDIEYHTDGESLTATVPPSPPKAPEVGAIEAAQAARHLAILGSCAAALTNPSDQRHHYLAVAATHERLGAPIDAGVHQPLTATAHAVWHDKRTAIANMTLVGPDGEELNQLRVTYAVMKPNMFHRLNPRVDLKPGRPGPSTPLIVDAARGKVVADYGPVPMDLCDGHFPDQPVAPVALVMGRLGRTTREALVSQLGEDVAYRVEAAEVEATGLAQPGERLVLEASYERESGGIHVLSGRALAEGREVGAVQVSLTAITNPPSQTLADD